MATRGSKEHENNFRRMLKSGRYEPEFAQRLDELYLEWGLDRLAKKPLSQRRTVKGQHHQ